MEKVDVVDSLQYNGAGRSGCVGYAIFTFRNLAFGVGVALVECTIIWMYVMN